MCGIDANTFLFRDQAEEDSEWFRGLIQRAGTHFTHQRCDGKQPCTTCVNGERGVRCAYEPRQQSRRAKPKALLVSRDSAPRPLGIRTLPSEPSTVGFLSSERPIRPSLDIPLLTWSNSGESDPPLLPPLAPFERPLTSPSHARDQVVPDRSPPPGALVVRNIHDTTGCISRPTVSSFTILPSIHFQTIPWPLQVPLSIIPPERVQVSPIAGGDLDMTLYVLIRFSSFHVSWALNHDILVA